MTKTKTKVKEIKPFRQVPSADANTRLSITGAEFEAIQSVINLYKNAVNAVQEIFDRNINEGNIVIRYVQADGTEITREEAEEYLKAASAFLEDKDAPNI